MLLLWSPMVFASAVLCISVYFFFSSRRRHTRLVSDWSSDVCSSDLHAGYPRVYAIASEYLGHTASRFDHTLLLAFVQAYQRVAVLRIGELWALAITLDRKSVV